MFWNAQGLKRTEKSQELANYLKRDQMDIICICETFLKERNNFSIDGYECIRRDRTVGRLGGLAILIKSSIKYKQIGCPSTALVECMGIELQNNDKKLIIMNAYLPGGATSLEIQRHYKNDLIALTNTREAFYIVGDLNSKHYDWNCSSNNLAGNILKSLADTNNFFIEHPQQNTYCPMSMFKSPSTIDILITNGKIAITDLYTRNIFSSDHIPVICSVNMYIEYINVKRFNFNKADWPKFRDIINNGLNGFIYNNIQSKDEIDLHISRLTELVIEAKVLAVPKQNNGPDGIFIDHHTKFLIRMRNYFRRNFLRYHNLQDKEDYYLINRIVRRRINQLKIERWETKLKDCDTSNKNIFKLTKAMKRKRTTVPDLVNGTVTADSDKAELLGNHFCQMHMNPLASNSKKHTKLVNTVVRNYFNNSSSHPHPDHIITYENTAKQIKSLKNGKCPGKDGICNRLLKNLPNRAINYLTYLFNQCLLLCYFPPLWKTAIVIPIAKSGQQKDDVKGYRPISLLPAFGKLFEKLLQTRISQYLEDGKYLPKEQFGFRKGHSTTAQLLRVYNHIKSHLNIKCSTGMIAFDVEKAFDRVWHNGLLYKLITINMPHYLTHMIASFLSDRNFSVRIGQATSSLYSINFGVPQGSVLSPILYNIFTYDIPKLDHCKLALFADDTAIFTSSRFFKDISKKLTRDTNKLARYFAKWKIRLNNNKSIACFFTKRLRKQIPQRRDKVKVGNNYIHWNDTLKYLGCTLDKRLTMKSQINMAITKSIISLKTLYPLVNRKSVLGPRVKNLIYKLYFRPVLTYPNSLMYRSARSNKKRIQISQNKLLRLFNNKPWDYKNETLHGELEIETIEEFLSKLDKRSVERSIIHDNDLIQELYS